MPSGYPSSLDSHSTGHVDNVGEIIHALTINDQADAVNKIEAELGTNPSGAFATVAARFSALGGGGGIGVNVQDFGAVGDGVADDTAAIQAAIDSIPQARTAWPTAPGIVGGGLVFFPRGDYKCASSLDLSDTWCITLLGEGATGGYSYRPPSTIRFTGTGSGDFINAKSAAHLTLRNLGIRYSNSGFTGKLINYSHSASGADSGSCAIDGCMIAGDGVYSAECLVYLDLAILWNARNSYFSWAQRGVIGNRTGYSNAIGFDNCGFDNLRISAFVNPGNTWAITSCTFEGTNGNASTTSPSAMQRAVLVESGKYGDIQIIGCWFGDATYWEHWVDVPVDGSLSLTMFANYVGGSQYGPSTMVKHMGLGDGITIVGNSFGGQGDGIDLGNTAYPVATKKGILISGNSFQVTGTPIVGMDHHYRVCIFANYSTSGSRMDDRLTIGGHLLASLGTADPTVAVQAPAGTGATAAVYGGDICGQVQVVTGTGTSAGEMVRMTFADVFTGEAFSADNVPHVFLVPRNADTAALQVYTTGDYTKFAISSAGAPTASKTYLWQYFVIQ